MSIDKSFSLSNLTHSDVMNNVLANALVCFTLPDIKHCVPPASFDSL